MIYQFFKLQLEISKKKDGVILTKLIILDDHELFALGLKNILSVENNISVVDILTEHESLGESIRKHNPDVILSDIRLKKNEWSKINKVL